MMTRTIKQFDEERVSREVIQLIPASGWRAYYESPPETKDGTIHQWHRDILVFALVRDTWEDGTKNESIVGAYPTDLGFMMFCDEGKFLQGYEGPNGQ